MINKQLTKNDPIFYVVNLPSKAASNESTYQVKHGFFLRTVETNGNIVYVVSPMSSGVFRATRQVDSKHVFLTEEEANAFVEDLKNESMESI
jgi:hypothetical protein